jgi:hypothetical protein
VDWRLILDLETVLYTTNGLIEMMESTIGRNLAEPDDRFGQSACAGISNLCCETREKLHTAFVAICDGVRDHRRAA